MAVSTKAFIDKHRSVASEGHQMRVRGQRGGVIWYNIVSMGERREVGPARARARRNIPTLTYVSTSLALSRGMVKEKRKTDIV
eukprot:scaffold1476_cov136-Skeletonema_menzelii.AAC.3